MEDNNKRNFILNIFKDRYGENIEDLSSIIDRINEYKKYAERKANVDERSPDYEKEYLEEYKDILDFPADIELSPQDIKEIIEKIYWLSSWGADEKERKEVAQYIFGHISDESKIAFFHSNEFQELYENRDWDEEFAEIYNVITLYNSISEEKRPQVFESISRMEEAKLKFQIGILDTNLTLKEALRRYCDSLGNTDSLEYHQNNLELMLALKGIEVDLSQFSKAGNKEAFLASDEFKTLMNRYYESIEGSEKKAFIKDLAYGNNGGWRKEWLGYNSEDMKLNLQIFNTIEDEAKYDCATINVLAGLLENNLMEDNSKRLNTIFRMYEIKRREDYIYNYLERTQNGEFERFNMDSMQIEELLARQDADNEKLLMGIFSSLNPENIMDYLRTCPDNISFCMNALEEHHINELLSEIDDDVYKARLLLSLNANAKTIAAFFPHIEDDYIRAQLVIAKSDNEIFISNEHSMNKIENYIGIRESFFSISDDFERAEYLCSIETDVPNDPTSSSYKDGNEIKKSLLKYIENPEDRNRVIETMGRYVQPDMEEYVKIVEQMMKEYVEGNLELTSEQKEKMEIEIRATDVYFTDYIRSGINGQSDAAEKTITLANHSRGDDKNIVIDMLHEYSHIFSRSDFLRTGYFVGNTFEEGMADTFAEQVANYYFGKYGSVEIGGNVLEPELPLISQSSYIRENAIVKSMLYPLEESRRDKKAIQEFVFGNKNIFFDLTMGEGFSERVKHDYAGNPLDINIDELDMSERYSMEGYRVDRDSLYRIKNGFIETLAELARQVSHTNPIEERLSDEQIRFRTSIGFSVFFSTRYESINTGYGAWKGVGWIFIRRYKV